MCVALSGLEIIVIFTGGLRFACPRLICVVTSGLIPSLREHAEVLPYEILVSAIGRVQKPLQNTRLHNREGAETLPYEMQPFTAYHITLFSRVFGCSGKGNTGNWCNA